MCVCGWREGLVKMNMNDPGNGKNVHKVLFPDLLRINGFLIKNNNKTTVLCTYSDK